MRENRFNRNPQVNGILRGVLSLSCFFFCLHMLPKVSPSFQVHLFIPPQTTWHSCHVFLFFMSFAERFYCKCRTWNGTWVCELYGAKPLFRKHCKAVLCPIPVTMSVLLYFQSAEICSDFSLITTQHHIVQKYCYHLRFDEFIAFLYRIYMDRGYSPLSEDLDELDSRLNSSTSSFSLPNGLFPYDHLTGWKKPLL